jgi:hypothetical protein
VDAFELDALVTRQIRPSESDRMFDQTVDAQPPRADVDAGHTQVAKREQIRGSRDVIVQLMRLQGLEAKGGTPADALREVQAEQAFWTGLMSEFGSLAK